MGHSTRIIDYVLGFAAVLLLFGFMFRIMHWPGGGIMILFPKLLFGLVYPYKFMLKGKRSAVDNLKVLCVFIWAISGVFIFYLERVLSTPFRALSWAAFFAWIALLIYDYALNARPADERTTPNRPGVIAFIAGSGLLIIGIFFKIMHWPYSTILMATGTTLGLVWIFEGIFKNE